MGLHLGEHTVETALSRLGASRIAATVCLDSPRGALGEQHSTNVRLDIGIREMLDHFSGNDWFVNRYWPENEPRVRLLLSDLTRLVPAGGFVFEPGCGNGFISFLASRL